MWLMVLEPLGSRVARSAGIGQVAPARLLPGPRRPPRQGSRWGSPPRPFALCVYGLGVALPVLCFSLERCFGILVLLLPPFAPLSVAAGAALTACAQVEGEKGEPLLLYTDTRRDLGLRT